MAGHSIGLIGLGAFGQAVAEKLIEAGHAVIGYRRSAMDEFVAAGGTPAASPRDLAGRADIILDALPNGEAFETIMADIGPVIGGTKIVASIATYPVETKRRVAEKLAAHGVTLLDCEVSGTPHMVRARKSVIYASGDPGAVDTAMPVLKSITDNVFNLGAFGNASLMKLIANHLVAVNNMAAAEAMALASKAGLDLDLVVKVVGPGAGGSTMFSIRAPMMAKAAYKPAPGAFNTIDKYIHLVEDLAAKVQCATPLMDVAAAYYQKALDEGRGEEDVAAMFEVIRNDRRGA